ncbi:MAG: PilZ domain-containing protein [Candidatus Omnitrophota bacterium]
MEFWDKDIEQRRSPRVGFHSRIRYQFRGRPDFDSGVSRDISYTGLKLANEQFIPTCALVMLEINIFNRVLRPIGKVAWSRALAHSNRNQTGIEFIEFDVLEHKCLKDFIDMRK